MLETESRRTTIDVATDGGSADYVSKRGELDLFLLALLVKRKGRRTMLTAVAGLFVVLVMLFFMKPRYSASAALLVPQPSSSGASIALKLAMGGLDLGGGTSEVYEDILESKTVADRLIAQYGLKGVYRVKYQLAAQKELASRTKIVTSKEGLVRVTVQDEDPKRAADLANSYLAELDRMNEGLAITSAGQQRLYFEREMVKEKDALAEAEVELKKTQESTGILVPQAQVAANIGAIEQTRAQLRLRQVQLGALLQGATQENPNVLRLQAEIKGLENQLQAMQSGSDTGVATGIPTSKTPERALEYIRKEREVKFHEAVFALLAKQYELAKQEEAKTVSMIEVLDRATVPERKTWPPKTVFCLLGLLGGALVGVVWTLVESFIQAAMSNPDNQEKYQALMGTRHT
ncbi:GNVR domain-containing protein [Tunturiibacter lichenicola]|uniref:GNVR domain-containing protein n=1 Tax=Tunturiibacter lichenicola TaxID=2051959 RepID=UPI0021B476B5|nr:GNVR domain-containing protein [Edaphobacter lichenicola]